MKTTILYDRNMADGKDFFGVLYLYHGEVKVECVKPYWGKSVLDNNATWQRSLIDKWEEVPVMSEIVKQRVPTYDQKGKYECEYKDRIVDNFSECGYHPVYIPKDGSLTLLKELCYACDTPHNKRLSWNKLVSQVLGIPRIEEIYKVSKDYCIERFVVAVVEDIKVSIVNNVYTCIIRSGKLGAKQRIIEVPWKERWDNNFVPDEEKMGKRWKKVIRCSFPVSADNNLSLIFYGRTRVLDSWPQNEQVKEDIKRGFFYDYGNPSMFSKEYKEEQERIRQKEEEEQRKLEILKKTDGYCDKCGAKAERIRDPYRGIDGWLCHSCYSDEYDYC